MDEQTKREQSVKFTWRIENFTRLKVKKHYSDIFVVGSYKWRILVFPKGNYVNHLSVYLAVADSAKLPYGWSRYARFSLAVVSQAHTKYTIRKDSLHQFNARKSDWGFTSFIPLSELHDPTRGYLLNDTCIIEAEVEKATTQMTEVESFVDRLHLLEMRQMESHKEVMKYLGEIMDYQRNTRQIFLDWMKDDDDDLPQSSS